MSTLAWNDYIQKRAIEITIHFKARLHNGLKHEYGIHPVGAHMQTCSHGSKAVRLAHRKN
ncbi:hypothetical protein AG1IA_07437 [Rhizoctonia solani AG-1 IA]|uniref:Uncharacterized protein n=1 Tax=Thanatephorus cucumeris (strain AG1-IA) TaxID=983506 RepID=L8WKR3_THACA|nr:hypothetical protein AG1IA_07437 [Rhizoctonia solani AG-1 IA]